MRKALPWPQIETEYVTGDDAVTFASLGKTYGCRPATIHARSQKGEWIKKRNEYRNKTVMAAQRKMGATQAYTIAQSIEIIQSLTNNALKKIQLLTPESYERTMREIRENIKTINMYLGEPTERIEMSGEQRERLIAVFTRLKTVAPNEYEELKAIYGYESANN